MARVTTSHCGDQSRSAVSFRTHVPVPAAGRRREQAKLFVLHREALVVNARLGVDDRRSGEPQGSRASRTSTGVTWIGSKLSSLMFCRPARV
jgi:hypothetical protein